MKKTNSNQNENKTWAGATAGAIIAGSVATAFSRFKHTSKLKTKKLLLVRKWFIFTVVFLIACVLLTTFLLIGHLDQYLYIKEHNVEIDLLEEPGFVMDDGSGNMVFSTESTDTLFHASYYADDGQTLNVLSAEGDDVIAPGTSGEYVFRLKNTDRVPLIYSVVLDGFFSVENTEYLIPVLVRMKGQDGSYLIGSDTEWSSISELKNISDAGTLRGRASRTYTLEWMWPFESGDDALDTMLGNGTMGVGGAPTQEFGANVDFSLQIETVAMLPVEDRAPFTIFFDRVFPYLLTLCVILLITTLVIVFKYRYSDRKTD